MAFDFHKYKNPTQPVTTQPQGSFDFSKYKENTVNIPRQSTPSLTPKQAPSFTDWMMEQATAPLKQAGEGIMNFAGGTMDVLGKTAQGDIGGALQGVGRTLGGFGQIATSPMAPAINAGRNLPQFVQDTIQTAKPSFEKTLAGAGQVGRGFQQGNVKDVVYGGAKALSGGIGTAFSPVGGMMAQLPREIQQGAGVVGQGFSALRGAVPALTGQTGTETGEFMGDVFDIGMTALPFAGKGIAKAIGKTKTGQAIKEGANMFKQDIAQGYAQNIQPNLQAINRAVKAPVDVALNRFGELPGKARPLVGKATSGLVNQFYGIPEKAQKTIMSGNKYMKMADDGAFNEQIFLETAVKSIKDRKQALATTGKEYNTIRQSPVKAQIPEDVFASTLQKDYGLQVKNGKILYDADTASISLDPTTLKKLQDTYNTFKYNPGEVSINRLLNTRKGLDNMSKWDASVDYGTLGEIARKVRKKLDSYSPKELKSIDAKYAPEVQMLADVEKYLLDPKGRIKDSAESFISNLGGKGKTAQLKKLSKVIPDLEAQVDAISAIKALERAQGSYAGGSQAVKGMLTGGVLGGATAMANPLLGIPATMAGMMLSNPKIGTALLKGASKMKSKLNLPTPQTPSTTTMKQALQQSVQELSTVGRNIKSGTKSFVESQKGLKGGFIDTDLLTGKKMVHTGDDIMLEAKKYKSQDEFISAISNNSYDPLLNKINLLANERILRIYEKYRGGKRSVARTKSDPEYVTLKNDLEKDQYIVQDLGANNFAVVVKNKPNDFFKKLEQQEDLSKKSLIAKYEPIRGNTIETTTNKLLKFINKNKQDDVGITHSRSKKSQSQYIELRNKDNLVTKIRVSDHDLPMSYGGAESADIILTPKGKNIFGSSTIADAIIAIEYYLKPELIPKHNRALQVLSDIYKEAHKK